MTSPQPPQSPSVPASAASSSTGSTAAAGKLAKDEGSTLQLALRSENAAIWAYALVAANDTDPNDVELIAQMRAGHLVRRDAAAGRLADGGVSPAPPAPAYATPAATDLASARKLAIAIETDCAAAWQSVVASSDNGPLRAFAAGGLSDAAVRLAQWKQRAKVNPLTVPFPGTSG